MEAESDVVNVRAVTMNIGTEKAKEEEKKKREREAMIELFILTAPKTRALCSSRV